jgi:hypothetical protein
MEEEELALLLGVHVEDEDDKEEKGGHLPEEQEEEEEDEKEEMKESHLVGFAVVGTSTSGPTEGKYGFFFPLYMTENEAQSMDTEMGGEGVAHTHTFEEYPDMTFYMPDSSDDHGVNSLPLGIPLMQPSSKPKEEEVEVEEEKEAGVVLRVPVEVGDYVMWEAEKGTYRGQVARVQREGDAGVGSSRQEATEDNPIAHVTVLANLGDGQFMITDREFPVNFSRLKKIGKPDIVNESVEKQSQAVKDTLKKKADDHNEKHGDDDRKKTRASTLYEVFKRGVGAYRNNPGSVRPTVTSEEQWAYARVNGFLYALRNLKFKNKPYDTDLLPSAHPLSSKSFELADVEEAQAKDVDLSVPSFIRANAERGLKMYEDGLAGDGLVSRTVTEARAMARGEITEDKVKRMRAWFARHRPDLQSPKNSNPDHKDYPGPGAVAWLLWGGNPTSNAMQAYNWADRKMQQIEDDQGSESRTLIYESVTNQIAEIKEQVQELKSQILDELGDLGVSVKNISALQVNTPKDQIESGVISEALVKALEMTTRVTRDNKD